MGDSLNLISKWLGNADIFFGVANADKNIVMLPNPDDFYQLLLKEIDDAQEQILWSSLYLGSGNLEKELLRRLSCKLKANSNVKFSGIFDYCRGLRGTSLTSTVGMFQPLVVAHNDRVSVFLFRSPYFRGLKSFIPQRWNEIFSVHHMKIYVFDSTVILSGANLSNDYFTNRQDRYIVIRKCPLLAEFCRNLITTIGKLSFVLTKNGNLIPAQPCLIDLKNSYLLQQVGHDVLRDFLKTYKTKTKTKTAADTVIFPFLQSAPLKIRDEERVTDTMLTNLTPCDRIFLTTSYFNLTKSYQNALLNICRSREVKIVVSSPHSNGFSNASGFSRFVPHGYIHFSQQFIDKITANNLENRFRVYEYERDSWTFHSKGIWLYNSGALSQPNLPYCSFIGSTNFSFRSVNRDQEAQFILVSSNEIVRKRLQAEVDDLRRWCFKLNKAVFQRADHTVARWVPLASKIARYFF